MADRYQAVYLSPHLDDAALSCGGQIARRTAAGERVLVITLFAADEPAAGVSELAREVHLLFGLEREVVATRRREDEAACRILGAEHSHWSLPEAIYRRDPTSGAPLYSGRESLFPIHDHRRGGPPIPAERELLAELASRIGDLPPHGQLVAPLAVGGHVDHRLTRLAAETVHPGEVAFYEDYPYAERFRAVARKVRPRRHWRSEVVPLDGEALDLKIDAIAAYRSQIGPLFGGHQRLARQVRRYARKVGGERLWLRAEEPALG